MAKYLILFLSILVFHSLGFSKTESEAGLCVACEAKKSVSKISLGPPKIDEEFIKKSEGKIFDHVRPKAADGEPNCVAAALRAGGYLPGFALNGTDSFYEEVLPDCFKKIDLKEAPQKGDIGLLYAPEIPTLAHAYLFIDSQTIFEKPSPQNKDKFGTKSYANLKEESSSSLASGFFRQEVWRFSPKDSCILSKIQKKFENLPETSMEKLISKEIDQRIYSGDWKTPTTAFTKKQLLAFKKEQIAKLEKWFLTLPGGFKKDRDYRTSMEMNFTIDLIKTIERTPLYN